ncbi:hypothetical protein LH464_09555 [Neorhizobium sp. T786]|uniref:hypothetical protein n=1 Tax=Pseudorhizobium xiangyangii TaxID=2883104 RepID=UPI001CFF6751|nr:hypothetical protein [Neorhizobium xiangyangii]MCB5202717.1 hypothetical protein [Neorhizobium xiangyangii]
MLDRDFYPEILSSDDVKLLHDAVRNLVESEKERAIMHDPESLAKIVLRLYRNGLTEPGKLMSLASLVAARQAEQKAAD